MTHITDRKLKAGFYYRIETDTPVRFHTGMGPRFLPADAVETDGSVYVGIDLSANLPSFSLLASGTADRLTIGMAGVSDRMTDLVDADADEVEGRAVHIGLVLYDENDQLARPPYWMKNYKISKVGFSVTSVNDPEDDETHVAGVSVTMGYGDVRRKKGKGGYWTPDRAATGDLGLSNVPGLASGVTRPFPPPGK